MKSGSPGPVQVNERPAVGVSDVVLFTSYDSLDAVFRLIPETGYSFFAAGRFSASLPTAVSAVRHTASRIAGRMTF